MIIEKGIAKPEERKLETPPQYRWVLGMSVGDSVLVKNEHKGPDNLSQVLAAFHFHDMKYTLRREKKKKLDWKTRKAEPRTRDFRIWRDA